jgi:hypothetical protein
MFNEVVEAIDLLYFLTDRHKPKRRKKRNWIPSLEYLCDEVSCSYCPGYTYLFYVFVLLNGS